MDEDYEKAYKKGMKYYRKCISKGAYPYLPVLDEILPGSGKEAWTDAGTMNVPAEFVIGTKTAGRSHDFAGNFLPIAEEKSEFVTKWKRLCQAHLDEGIRDAVVAYEYMNRYYVQEGNKRVSVLKYFDAVSIPAQVRRILPEKSDDPAVKVYFEFLDFYKLSHVNFIEFSEPGSYRDFQELAGKAAGETWTEDEARKFRRVYYNFEHACKDADNENYQTNIGDVFLNFLRIYGKDTLWNMTSAEMKKILVKAGKEMTLQKEKDKIQVETEAKSGEGKGLSKLFPKKKLKAAFLYSEDPGESEWAMGHESGRLALADKFDKNVETAYYVLGDSQNRDEIMKKVLAAGYDAIFATSPEMLQPCLKTAIDHPEIIFLVCGLNKPHSAVRMYYPRMYEAKFVSGAIAGALCENHKIGYICRYPIFGNIAEINAFARGVAMTDPAAKVYLEWSADLGTEEAAKRLNDQGISLISVRDHVHRSSSEKMLYGLTRTENGVNTPLLLPIWNWGVYYEKIIRNILDGTFRAEEKTSKALNYYWGISSGVVDMVYSGKLPKGVRYLGETLFQGIADHTCRPFYNPKSASDGRIIWNTKDQAFSMAEILNMDWLEDNIVGKIPSYKDLDEKAKALVDVMGISQAKKTFTSPEEK